MCTKIFWASRFHLTQKTAHVLDEVVKACSTFLDLAPRMLGPKNQLIKVIENNRIFLECPFFGSPLPELRWWAFF